MHRFLEDIREQVNKAVIITGCLNNFTWKNNYLRKYTKGRICITIVRSALTYRTEKKGLNIQNKQLFVTDQTRSHGVRNQDRRRMCNKSN